MKKITHVIFILLLITICFGCKTNSNLKVNLNYQAIYTTQDNSKVKADFYSFSDESLYFVKVHIQDKTITLSRTIAASGERYIDITERIEFWAKGDTAFLDYQNENGTKTRIDLTKNN